MTERFIALVALLVAATPVQAHQIWIEQSEGQNAVVRFGEFGENLREASPGLLDKFAKVTGTLISAKGEQKSEATKTANGFSLPFTAAPGDGIIAQDANYPLYTWKQQGKDTTNWFYPAARYITGFAAQQPRLVLDLVPAGEAGQFKLFFKDQPKAKTKVTLVATFLSCDRPTPSSTMALARCSTLSALFSDRMLALLSRMNKPTMPTRR